MMGVETQGTERGWASLCAGVIKNEPITRYGNWYGPGYWGGGEDPDKAGLKAPVDSLDAIAMRHDYGYLVAEKYGKIYGKQYEYRLKALADMAAVRDSMKLPEDPAKWDKVPADIEAASRYRDRIITGFIMESDLYKNLADATKVGDAVTSPFITWFDEIDYSHIPDLEKLDREVSSHINGWKKEVDKYEADEKKIREHREREKARQEKEFQEADAAEKSRKETDEKQRREAEEARKRLEEKIRESKQEPTPDPEQKKSYGEMTPEERREALKQNDDEAWNALQRELTGADAGEGEKEEEQAQKGQPIGDSPSDIPPVKITASGSIDEDYSADGIANIVTTTMSLSFWNVGGQVPGYGGATMKSRSVSSLNGSTFESSCSGTFSGGPNGVIRLGGDCDGMTLGIQGGTSIDMEDLVLTISNPSAFSYWK